jgi:hypothetical protein
MTDGDTRQRSRGSHSRGRDIPGHEPTSAPGQPKPPATRQCPPGFGVLADRLDVDLAYITAAASYPGYTERFLEDLEVQGARIPLPLRTAPALATTTIAIDDDPARQEQLFNLAVAEGEAVVQPYRVRDDLCREPEPLRRNWAFGRRAAAPGEAGWVVRVPFWFRRRVGG